MTILNTDVDVISPRYGRCAAKLLLLLFLLVVSSCMSHPKSSITTLDDARQALTEAQRSELPLVAADLNQARQLIEQAELAEAHQQTTMAFRLAERAKLIAELAVAKAELHRAQWLNDELSTRIDALMLARQHSEGEQP